jgi:hypothetical protein
MPVLTARQLRDSKEGQDATGKPEEVVPVAQPEESPPEPAVWVRMYHPDDPMHAMNLILDIDGEKLQMERGAVIVRSLMAEKLELRGWLRGSEVRE